MAIGLEIDRIVDYIQSMETLTISKAKAHLGELADRALQGEPVLIVRKSRLLVLKEYVIPEPIPDRPDGYFADEDSAAELHKLNKLAKHSIRKLVK